MRESVRRILDRLRARRRGAESGPPTVPGPSEPPPVEDMTGLTVFDDIALRLRSLTTEELDASKGDPGALPGAFKIRLAKSRNFRKGAGTLVERRYADRGYQIPGQNEDPNLFTFVAYDEGQLVGTVSIRLDSEAGLAADALYRGEIDDLRNADCKVCEFTRLAVDVKAVSKPVLAGLFHTAYLYASEVRGFNFAVIEVNPRHVAFYAKALGFEPIGPERLNTRVNAPAVLLCVPFENISSGLKKYAGDPEGASKSRSLFPYGFPQEEESGILKRLLELEVVRAGGQPGGVRSREAR